MIYKAIKDYEPHFKKGDWILTDGDLPPLEEKGDRIGINDKFIPELIKAKAIEEPKVGKKK